jgi:hypothetical protein
MKRNPGRIVDGKLSWSHDDEMREILIERDLLYGAHMANGELYDPPMEKRIPKEGAWVMITRPPRLDRKFRFEMGQVFYATRWEGSDDEGFVKGGYYKILATTPWGQCGLLPYEYFVPKVEFVIECYQKGELLFHAMTETPRLTDALFYCRSRGIGVLEAMPMVLGSFQAPVGWFEMTPELVKEARETFGDPWRIGSLDFLRGKHAELQPRRADGEPDPGPGA